MSHIIEHVYDPLEQLRECYRILKPGKYMVLVTPNINALSHRRFKEACRLLEPPRHLHIFSPQALRCLSEKAGFQRLKLITTIHKAHNIYLSSRIIQRSEHNVFSSTRKCNLHRWARFMQLIEWMILRLKPDVGTEITLIGYK
jgi:predicted SAM-dependent methyltransferase